MAVLIFPALAAAEQFRVAFAAIPAIEGGNGAIALGFPAVADDGRAAMSHPLAEVDVDWCTAQGVTVLDALPTDWQWPEAEI